ncbi:hypothetical protein [Nocardioides bizhenqiangii]|uniref:Fibronectin type-III domain-containing protein n=1 Tax=Nocardioides bizhenqiangii TaxID=3095076 RepID=A0ABZ0ZMV0_9ACTN|nr:MULTISPECIES: hypothetical protein [unclassified Nocardioides]MDZ5621581.1 hypothetical protein [Nocardioides sp. HM23]WQQ25582.1 hypothetical protein SHK19_16645 [Nocardioides sp. HM61]
MTMRRERRGGVLAKLLCWAPVTAVVVALFAMPSSTGAARLGSLTVTPGGNTYGGQSVRFHGDMGNGEQRIFLQRRGCPTCIWSEVVDPRDGRPFSILTQANGEFDFMFPAPAMNAVYVRLHSRQADTDAHQFKTVHQDADVFLDELAPADVPLPRGFAVVGEAYDLRIDTVRVPSGPKRPALAGRRVELQQRDESTHEWTFVAQGQLGPEGLAAFSNRSPVLDDSGVYRTVLGDWTQGGDDIGWFPSLPFHVEVVRRPDPVTGLVATDVTTSSIRLSWNLPADPERRRIVIARTSFGDPNASNPSHVIATIDGEAKTYLDDHQINPSASYNYAVYTRSADGVYTRLSTDESVRTPDPKRGEQ